MSSLTDAQKRLEQRRQQQQQNAGGHDLWFRENDLVIAHFLATGQDDDPYFETYVAHEQPAKGEGKWPTLIYCPVESGHDENYDCQGCRDNLKTKDRMAMWFWVYSVLHSQLKANESFPQVTWNNKMYFNREINGPRLWDTSAWQESPIDDIIMLGNQLGNLQAMRMNLVTTGSGLKKRYKIYTEPNTGSIDEENLAAAQETIVPIIDILMGRLSKEPVQQNPQASSAPAGEVKPYQPANKPKPYVPGGGGGAKNEEPQDLPFDPDPPKNAPKAPVAAAKGKTTKGKDLF